MLAECRLVATCLPLANLNVLCNGIRKCAVVRGLYWSNALDRTLPTFKVWSTGRPIWCLSLSRTQWPSNWRTCALGWWKSWWVCVVEMSMTHMQISWWFTFTSWNQSLPAAQLFLEELLSHRYPWTGTKKRTNRSMGSCGSGRTICSSRDYHAFDHRCQVFFQILKKINACAW